MKFMQASSAASAAVAGGAPIRPRGVAGLALAMLTASLGAGIGNVALPSLAATFGASFAAVQWVVIAYLWTSTAAVVAVGRLGDVVGGRRLLLAGLAVFATASAGCALAPSLPVLVAARAVQGLGAAVLMALTVALARSVVARERTGAAMGLLGTMSALGTALGPSLGGGLLTVLGWRAVFAAGVPLALAAIVLVGRQLPPDRERGREPREHFDGTGSALLALALAGFAVAATATGLGAWRFAAGCTAVVGAVAFVAAERRAVAPLLPLPLLRERGLGVPLLANTVVSAVVMATLVVGPFHLAHALGLSPGRVGLVMSAGPLVAALVGMPAGRLVDRLGPQRVAAAGLLGVGAGTVALAALAGRHTVAAYVVPLVATTASYALFTAATATAVMANADAARRGLLSGLLTLSRNLGLMTGASVLGALFAQACGTREIAAAAPDTVAAATRATFLAAALAVGAVAPLVWARSDRT